MSEPESIAKISACLREAQRCSVVITNLKKDKSIFRNLLCMKPIFNSKKEYCYVFGLQLNVTSRGSCENEIKFVESLMDILPDSVECFDVTDNSQPFSPSNKKNRKKGSFMNFFFK